MTKSGIILLFLNLLIADDPSTIFKQANIYAEKANYQKAIEKYESLIDMGYESGALYYNLGNSYYRLDQLGLSLWAYYCSQKLIPRDSDLLHNLKVAKAKCLDRIEFPNSFFPFDFFRELDNSFKINELFLFGSLLILIFSSLRIMKKTMWLSIDASKNLNAILVIVIFMVHSLAFRKYFIDYKIKYGVVITNSVNVLSGPNNSQSSIIFVANEGLKVKINSIKDKWIEVELIDGKKGWLHFSSIREI